MPRNKMKVVAMMLKVIHAQKKKGSSQRKNSEVPGNFANQSFNNKNSFLIQAVCLKSFR